MYELKWEQRALDELNKLDSQIARRILKKINELLPSPFSKDVKKLNRFDGFRLGIGNYRVIFSVQDSLIKILKVGHRKNIYD